VAGENMADRGRLTQRIVNRQDGAARVAGDDSDALTFKVER
jgi:hypothetical protein